jgi:uncharacterized protein
MLDHELRLFEPSQVVGVFRGFREGGTEFHADLALPYRRHFQNIPMHGQFVLVQLETPYEAILGRVTSLASEGRLSSPAGEDYNIRAARDGRAVSEQLREDYLKYRVNIRVLGGIRCRDNQFIFVPSHRRLPHVGSPVAFPTGRVLEEIAGHHLPGAELGYLALGEFIYAKGDPRLQCEDWMQMCSPTTIIKFPIDSLVSRRTFVFARAGFGKSNLNKLLFSHLYSQTPTIEKRNGRLVPVGTIIFDPDGEYFWPDDRGRPALCDVPALQERLVVFTPRRAPSAFYQSFVAGDIKLDIRRLRPADVISIGLPAERQEQQNVRKLRGLDNHSWVKLIDLIYKQRNNADLDAIKELIRLESSQDAEALAARANMSVVVSMLHDPSSHLLEMLMEALSTGKICIIDVSQLRGGPSLVLSGLILRKIFDRNQEEFTRAEPKSIPTIAVVEEAQTVLNERSQAATPYLEWVKEGRKYDLGAVLITQQPGSIPSEILSQGDNWFIFHLLSAFDLQNVRKANAHFSDDLLSSLLNEPIPGQGMVWSSVSGRPFPIPVRILSFERLYQRIDHDYTMPAVATYASQLRQRYEDRLRQAQQRIRSKTPRQPSVYVPGSTTDFTPNPSEVQDALSIYKANALQQTVSDQALRERFDSETGIAWGGLVARLARELPEDIYDERERHDIAYGLVREAANMLAGGPEKEAWISERRQNRHQRFVWYVRKKS